MAAIPYPLPPPAAAPRRTIPFDYSFNFELRGEPGRAAVSNVVVSVEGPFVATAVGYGFRPRVENIVFGGTRADFPPPAGIDSAPRTAPVNLARISLQSVLDLAARRLGEQKERAGGGLGAQTGAVLEAGFRLNPAIARQVLLGGSLGAIDDALLPRLFEILGPPPEDIQFLYAISDPGSGREFQSGPILNTAGLGDPRGVRPFRQFAAPIVFEPRSTIRMEVTEVQTVKGTLHVSLHGYKVLGGAGGPAVPTPPPSGPPRRRRR
jgi:hypothetical protein